MPKKEVPLLKLADYMPNGTYEPVAEYLNHYKVHLTIAKSRNSILGDYRHKIDSRNHRISVNGNLNKFAFLITLLHELAHLITFEKYGRRVQSHGKEWKTIYGQILAQFIEHKVFPQDIEKELHKTLKNPGASTCAEDGLQRVLYQYNIKRNNHMLVEQIPIGSIFKINDGRRFQKGKKRIKRHECTELATGKTFLFNAVYEVELVETI